MLQIIRYQYTVCDNQTWKINQGSPCLFAKILSKVFSYNLESSPYSIKHFNNEISTILSTAAILK